ncbi:MAG TPA: sigma-70 family RNA polymerase sigma factor, partial [Candidatus Baltobacteraceae bacterium]|nr:sigma-70 family RNA polymerase sigma factor [Candidatus Baltobacteraceae bacterium]
YLLVVARGDEDAAREALQLAFVRVVKHIKVFDAEEKFWSWLTVLARSAFADEAKKRRRYFSFLERFASHSEVEFQNNGEADEKLRALLQGKLWSLSDDERQLVERKYFEHRGVREMAEELQTTEKAVESKLSRLRKKLKDAVLSDLKNEPPL